MKINDIKPEDVNKNKIYCYIDNKNIRIKEIKLNGKKIPENSGYYLISGGIKTKDGSIYPAIFGVSSDDSGEMFEAYFYIKGKWINQQNKNFLKIIGKKKTQVFPYTYHLNIKVEGDGHILNQF